MRAFLFLPWQNSQGDPVAVWDTVNTEPFMPPSVPLLQACGQEPSLPCSSRPTSVNSPPGRALPSLFMLHLRLTSLKMGSQSHMEVLGQGLIYGRDHSPVLPNASQERICLPHSSTIAVALAHLATTESPRSVSSAYANTFVGIFRSPCSEPSAGQVKLSASVLHAQCLAAA